MSIPDVVAVPRDARTPEEALAHLSVRSRRTVESRLRTLVATLTDSEPPADLGDLCDAVVSEVGHDPERVWLAYAVLAGRLPTDEDLHDALVTARLHGTWAALAPLVASLADLRRLRDVEVIRGRVICDVKDTAQSTYLSGIQRVVRETASRWRQTKDVTFLSWTISGTMLRELRDDERWRLFGDAGSERGGSSAVVVPWECTYICMEVISPLQSRRVLALAEHSRNEVVALGYDCIPITSADTVTSGMSTNFAYSLACLRRATRVAMISSAAAEEFRGVMRMGAGRRGSTPEVAAIPLPTEAREPSPEDLAEAASGLMMTGMPMVLVVGSHEPRKNHLAVLHAAERLWREGLRFNLVMVGAGSWKAEEYNQALEALLQAARPIQSIRALPDRLLWAAYRLAHCTLFPSLNEGFGLPVAESLAVGTPVITSDYGSMRDILAPSGAPLGGLLVNPRDDTSLLEALRTLLTDEATYQRVKKETAQHVGRTWDEYAAELWPFLVDGTPSAERPDPAPG
jgi:glycosyltransferase involved in cell wall biosynthesis